MTASVPMRSDSWDGYVVEYHDANPGITQDVLADAVDGNGRSPYDWLVEAVPPGTSTVVDLACGSGPLAGMLDATRVVGVDRSAGELGLARSGPGFGSLVRRRRRPSPSPPRRPTPWWRRWP